MEKTPILILIKKHSSRLPFKNWYLIKFTLDYLQTLDQLDRTYIVSDDANFFRGIAEHMKCNFIYGPLIWGAEEEHYPRAVLTAKHLGSDKFILANVTAPVREKWLLEAVETELDKTTHGQMVMTVAEVQHNTWRSPNEDLSTKRKKLLGESGGLYGWNVDISSVKTSADIKPEWFDRSKAIQVEHNSEALVDVDYLQDLLPENALIAMIQNVFHLMPPVKLPKQVLLVAQNEEVNKIDYSAFINEHPCVVRVNWTLINRNPNVGNKTDYLFSPHEECLKDYFDNLTEADNKNPKLVSCRLYHANPENKYEFDYTAGTVQNNMHQRIRGSKFVSTGFEAILWALSNGAEHVTCIGFGLNDGAPKTDARTGKKDIRPEWQHEVALRQILIDEGQLTLL